MPTDTEEMTEEELEGEVAWSEFCEWWNGFIDNETHYQ